MRTKKRGICLTGWMIGEGELRERKNVSPISKFESSQPRSKRSMFKQYDIFHQDLHCENSVFLKRSFPTVHSKERHFVPGYVNALSSQRVSN